MIRPNPHFNDPAFAQAASNLASLFAPPSGSEASGWANARAKQEEAERLRWLFENHADESASRRSALTGVQSYGQTPEGFRYNVDQDSATRRYGYDTQAATGRYGHDQTFSASRLNNADNNERALAERGMQEQGLMDRQLASPVILNQGQRAYLPPQTAEAAELMEILEGAPKPLSETEWKAGQNQRLLDNGQLTDDALIDAIMGDKTPVKAVDERGRPVFMSPGAAVREGAEAFQDRGQLSPRTYRTPEGRIGTTHDGGLTDAHSGAALPQGTNVTTAADTSETFGSGEMSTQRGNILERRAATQSMIDQARFIDERLANVDAGAATGVIGSMARTLNDIASQIQYAAQLTGVEIPPEVRDVTQYESTLRELGVINAEVQSGIVDLAYAMAQSRKGGRLNVQDVENAVRTIGGNLQDPVALRRVLRGSVDRAITDYNSFENIMRQQFGDALNLSESSFRPFGEASATATTPEPQSADGWTTLPNGVRIRERP